MNKLVAAKILLKGIETSMLKRDGKTLNEIIHSCRRMCEINDVQLSELKEVAELKLGELVPSLVGEIEPLSGSCDGEGPYPGYDTDAA